MAADDELPYTLTRGTRPLLVSIPHLGTLLPPELRRHLSDEAAILADTDWHLDRLYDFAAGLGATVLAAKVSRYVIDLNRPASDTSLYPGQTTTGLIPGETFRGTPLHASENKPDAAERARRLALYWRPYHDTLRAELDRLRAAHPQVLLWDAHSIASVLPRLFDGKLPDLNFGTHEGRSCGDALIERVRAAARDMPCTQVLSGRFKGGYITRHYGEPARGIHAIQLEMCQSLYMDETAPFAYRPELAAAVQPGLRAMLEAALAQLEDATPPPADT